LWGGWKLGVLRPVSAWGSLGFGFWFVKGEIPPPPHGAAAPNGARCLLIIEAS